MDHDDEDDEEPPLEKVEEEPLDDDDDDEEEEEEEETLLASAAANASSCAASLEFDKMSESTWSFQTPLSHLHLQQQPPGLILFDLLVHCPPLPHLKIQSGFCLK